MIEYPHNRAANEINNITGCSMVDARRIVRLIIQAALDPSVKKCIRCKSPFSDTRIGTKPDTCEYCGGSMK